MANGFVVAKLVPDKVYPGETEKIIADLRLPKGRYMVVAMAVVDFYAVELEFRGGEDEPDVRDLTSTAQLTIRKDNVRKGNGQPPLYFDTRTKLGTHSETFCLTLGADAGVPCRARLTFTNHLSRHYAAVSNIKITAITLDKLTLKN